MALPYDLFGGTDQIPSSGRMAALHLTLNSHRTSFLHPRPRVLTFPL